MAAFHKIDAAVAAHGAVAVTPNDSTVLPVTRSLYIGTQGDVVVTMTDGQTPITFKNASGILPIQVTGVLTASTATDIVALY